MILNVHLHLWGSLFNRAWQSDCPSDWKFCPKKSPQKKMPKSSHLRVAGRSANSEHMMMVSPWLRTSWICSPRRFFMKLSTSAFWWVATEISYWSSAKLSIEIFTLQHQHSWNLHSRWPSLTLLLTLHLDLKSIVYNYIYIYNCRKTYIIYINSL